MRKPCALKVWKGKDFLFGSSFAGAGFALMVLPAPYVNTYQEVGGVVMTTHGHEVSTGRLEHTLPDSTTETDREKVSDEAGSRLPVLGYLACLILTSVLIWSIWPPFKIMVQRWSNDARYSHGFLVPIYAVVLYYWPRERTSMRVPKMRTALGIGFLVAGAAIQLLGAYVGSTWLVLHSIVSYVLAVACLLGPPAAFPRILPSALFLTFMIPLPYRIETLLGPVLQSAATRLSTYTLQTIGLMAFAQGNVIHIDKYKIGVVEACSGLSMLMTFVAVSVAVALVMRRPLLDRLMLIMASVPVAVVANMARIVLTGFLYVRVGSQAAEKFYHDLAGWLMIPFALALLWVLARLWDWILVVPPETAELIVLPGRSAIGVNRVSGHAESGLQGTAIANPLCSAQNQVRSQPIVNMPTHRKNRR